MRLRDHRLRLMLAVSVAAFTIVIGRAIQVQGLDAASLRAREVSQQQNVITEDGLRGTIYSADGLVLAQEQPAVDIVANQPLVKHPKATAGLIANALGYRLVSVPHVKKKKPTKKQKKFIAHQEHRRAAYVREVQSLLPLLTGSSHFTYVARQLDPAIAHKILASHPAGLSGIPGYTRAYPNGGLASQLLGFTDIGSNGGKGGAGLEHLLNRSLSGRPGEQVVVKDPSGAALETVQLKAPENGRSVRLTINSSLESYVQQVLGQTVREFHAHGATAIVMNPHTGAIQAMASAPTYDDNRVHELPRARSGRPRTWPPTWRTSRARSSRPSPTRPPCRWA